jgi:hypothetical protein
MLLASAAHQSPTGHLHAMPRPPERAPPEETEVDSAWEWLRWSGGAGCQGVPGGLAARGWRRRAPRSPGRLGGGGAGLQGVPGGEGAVSAAAAASGGRGRGGASAPQRILWYVG